MSTRVYPVTPTAPACADYKVKINGIPVPTNTASVSRVPFNRRWPGHQRQQDQSEAVQFLSLATDEPLTLEIEPTLPFDQVEVRPRSLGLQPKIADGKITLRLDRPAYFTVEPFGRNRALHIFADPMPDYGIFPKDGDVLYFGAGEHDVGLIEMHSNQTLFLDEGAVVYASVYAKDAEHLRILGRGILDNSRNREEILFEANEEGNTEAVENARRRHTVELEYCKDILIDGITLRDSLVYNVRPVGCRDFTVRNVKIIGCWRYNSDGIDMHNCENVHISDCFLRTFDDTICVKGFDCYYDGDVEEAVRRAMYRNGEAYDVFRHVLVERCVIWNDWGKSLEIGAETKAEEISDVTFRDSDVIHLCGAALDCMNVDYADVHDVVFDNIRVEYDTPTLAPQIQESDAHVYENPAPDHTPATVCIEALYHPEYSRGCPKGRHGKNRNFLFQNIAVYGTHRPCLFFRGYDADHKTENVTVRNLTWNGTPLTEDDVILDVGNFCENIRIEDANS